LQHLAMLLFHLWFFSGFTVLPLFLYILGIVLVFPPVLPLVLLYFTWAWVWDRNAGKRGGRPSHFLRNMKIWKYICDYFPSRLVVQEPLDPSKTYIFATQPHGVFGWGVWTNFVNGTNGIQDVLPGVIRVLTIDPNFWFPMWRDIYMALGFASVSKESCDYLLSNGTSVLIVPGGIEEIYYSKPGTCKVLIKKRKGFIKLALEHGANLVPVFTFGETELFTQIPNPPGSLMSRAQLWVKKKFNSPLVFWWGRGYGPFPRKLEIVTIIGSPIEVKKKENFQEKDVDELQQRYLDALTALYDEYADKYAKGIKLELF